MRDSSSVALTTAQNLLLGLLARYGLVRPTDKRQVDQPQPLLDNEYQSSRRAAGLPLAIR